MSDIFLASEGDRRGILVPVLIDDVLPPLAFRMIEAAKLIDWDGSLSNNEFDLLSKSVARILDYRSQRKMRYINRMNFSPLFK
jgi:hypothetical protein